MQTTTDTTVRGDRAIGSGDTDRLGFREIAARIGTALVDHAADGGLVVGIVGAWGSGKSSLLFLIEDELSQLSLQSRPTVINFRPWLVGSRDALLKNLFDSLSQTINRIALEAGDATGISVEKAKLAAEAFRKFSAGFSRAGALVKFAGDAVGFAPAILAGAAMQALHDATEDKIAETPLPELKDKLVKALADLNHRFIITIDDVDRLEPREAIEVLRLARSVADFPNVVYLLCYDSEILSNSVEKAAHINDGHSYLEKIVQLTVMVPQPEPFRLRQWFSDELHKIASTKNEDELARLASVIDFEGGRWLTTPRAVVRALDSLRFFWPPLRDANADLADLVWLQLIKDGNVSLYRWIENYCATTSILSLGIGRVSDPEKAKDLRDLYDVVESGFFGDYVYAQHFAQHLAGIDLNLTKDKPAFNLYARVDERVRDIYIRNARLSSPDHYRLYFALAGPSHALNKTKLDDFWNSVTSDREATQNLILAWNKECTAGSLSDADILLERLKGADPEIFTDVQSINLLIAFSNCMDEAYYQRQFDRLWVNSLWDRAERLVPVLVNRLDEAQRAATLDIMFSHGKSIDWLTTILRRETFSHGRFGDRKRPKGDWLLTDIELDAITVAMVDRYRRLSANDIFALIDLTSLLFAWRQTGDADLPRKVVTEHITTDAGLIEALEGLTTTVNSSNRGNYNVLMRNNFEAFLDYDEIIARIENLKSGLDDEPLTVRARAIAQSFRDSDD